MTKGNAPINPTTDKQSGTGLTKREHFASLAMQGLLGIYDCNNQLVPNYHNVQYIVELSVKASDELIKQLNITE